MTLSKQAQLNLDGFSLPTKDLLPIEMPEPDPLPANNRWEQLPVEMPEPEEMDEEILSVDDYSDYSDDDDSDDDSEDVDLEDMALIEVSEEPAEVFVLPLVPGASSQEEIEIVVCDEEKDDENDLQDPWKWKTNNFVDWLDARMRTIPQHTGKDTAGLERAISYLEALDREISKGVRADINNVIDINRVEMSRDEIHKGIDRLHDRLDKVKTNKYPKRKKKADFSPEMVKEAQKSAGVGKIMVTVPLFISSVARTCINSMVSAGKDIEDCFDKLAKEYDFTPREEMELIQLLADMGYVMRRPRMHARDEEIDYTSTENFDWSANYPG